MTLFKPTALNIKNYIKFAEIHKDAEINSILLEQSKNFTTSDNNEDKKSNKKTTPIAEMKKIWKYSSINGGLILKKYLGSEKNIVIPSVIGRTPVTQIAESI